MNQAIAQAKDLRLQLHSIPEASGQETQTKAALLAFLRKYSDLELVDQGKWFYGVHREDPNSPSIAFRADMDAVMGADGTYYHGCGHDGHMSVMAALAASVSGKTLGKNLFFLFQHGEETGEGAKACLSLFEKEKVDAIYGFHNCPGFPAGAVLLHRATFACGSKGLILRFSGTQSHAAYPENGSNPIFPMAEFFTHWQELTDPARYRGMVLLTPVGFNAGSQSFGVAAGSGEICLTLRAWFNDDLEKLEAAVKSLAADLAQNAGITLTTEVQDEFPATVNDPRLYDICTAAAQKAGLPCLTPPEPFRWSEDFGWYASKTKAFLLGIGAGKNAPGLHTPQYIWQDAVTEAALQLFRNIIQK